LKKKFLAYINPPSRLRGALSSAYRTTITSPCAHFWRQTFTQRSNGLVETSLDDGSLCGALRAR